MSSIKTNSRTTLAPINKANDVSFSIPEWKNKQIQSLHEGYEKEIYISVPLSLTDFDSHDQIQFLSKPQKPNSQAFAYERQLVNDEDFGILAFIICMQQTIIGQQNQKDVSIENLKKKINDLNLCVFQDVPIKLRKHYENKILKKILFQYINKGSYNVSLLQILLRKNHVLKFALSLVSKSLLKRSGLIQNYHQRTQNYKEMKVCGQYFKILNMIKVRQKSIDSQNFLINMNAYKVVVCRKQNIIKKSVLKQKKARSNSLKTKKSSPKKQIRAKRQSRISRQMYNDRQNSRSSRIKEVKEEKRSNSLMTFIKKLICY